MTTTTIITNPLPVTLLSGFLGSGKTTLLQHLLRNKQGLRCAVIVNDMASVNIDATILDKSEVLQRDEQMVQMQNGCICCTLRQDLLEEVAKLSKSGRFDVLIIESTGISEPMQVAETFSFEGETMESFEGLQSLVGLAKLDTCVTVVDGSNIFGYFENSRFIDEEFADSAGSSNPERTVVDLLVDQIEFANVIVLNKVDLCTKSTLEKAEGLIRKLNPDAKIIRSRYSEVPISEILCTGMFDLEKASLAPGWLQSLNEPHVPETLEYGIGSFIYRARRPFHPQRLYDLVSQFLMIIEPLNEEHEDDGSASVNEDDNDSSGEDVGPKGSSDEDAEMEAYKEEEEREIAVRRAAKRSSIFAGLFRSKGFFWLATRPGSMGEWGQAGTVLTMKEAGGWFTDVPEAEWPIDSDEARVRIIQDFDQSDPSIGDRRQEIVFIGSVSQKEICAELNKCLLTEEEWDWYKNGEFERFDDPWDEWPSMLSIAEESSEVHC